MERSAVSHRGIQILQDNFRRSEMNKSRRDGMKIAQHGVLGSDRKRNSPAGTAESQGCVGAPYLARSLRQMWETTDLSK